MIMLPARAGRIAAGVVVASVAALLCIAFAAEAAPTASPGPLLRAYDAADEFLDTYLEADGRVVRVDQGGDTVSEGQAYAMLVAVGIGDEARFRATWSWTAAHLQRDDGLLAWRWNDGAVVDSGAATDADLLTAWALGLAGRRFGDATLSAESRRVARSIVERETVRVDGGRTLVAGPWATASGTVNPSYFVVGAMSQLWWITGDRAWGDIAASARRLLAASMTTAPHLPPDWATIAGEPRDAPDGTQPRFGYDAARTIVQLAVDCDPAGRALAADVWPFFEPLSGDPVPAMHTLEGTAIGTDRHPLVLVAAAAAADAADDGPAADQFLDRAEDLDDEFPTYYGSAWIALGRLWLGTSLLGGCG